MGRRAVSRKTPAGVGTCDPEPVGFRRDWRESAPVGDALAGVLEDFAFLGGEAVNAARGDFLEDGVDLPADEIIGGFWRDRRGVGTGGAAWRGGGCGRWSSGAGAGFPGGEFGELEVS